MTLSIRSLTALMLSSAAISVVRAAPDADDEMMDNAPPLVSMAATMVDTTTAKVCFSGPAITSNSWVGFGIPTPGRDDMEKAELVIAVPDGTGVKLLHGSGTQLNDPGFKQDAAGAALPITLSAADSSYMNGVLKACFTRPVKYANPTDSQHELILNGSSTYLWAVGTTSASGVPTLHSNRGHPSINLLTSKAVPDGMSAPNVGQSTINGNNNSTMKSSGAASMRMRSAFTGSTVLMMLAPFVMAFAL